MIIIFLITNLTFFLSCQVVPYVTWFILSNDLILFQVQFNVLDNLPIIESKDKIYIVKLRKKGVETIAREQLPNKLA